VIFPEDGNGQLPEHEGGLLKSRTDAIWW